MKNIIIPIAGIILGLAYWIIDSLISYSISGKPLLNEIIYPAVIELCLRLSVLTISIGISLFIKKMLLKIDRLSPKQPSIADKKNMINEKLFIEGPVIRFKLYNNKDNWLIEYISANIDQFGYKAEELISNKIKYSDIICPNDFKKITSGMINYSRSENTFEQDYRIVLPNKTTRWIYSFIIVNRNNSGEVVNYEGYMLDVTSSREASEALKKVRDELEERIKERTTELVDSNKKLTQEVLERKDIEKKFTEYQNKLEDLVKDRTIGLIKTVDQLKIEIRERKRSENALRESEKRFRAIADYTYDMEIWVYPNGRLVWINKAVERITGYNTVECKNMKDFPISIIYHEDQPKMNRAFTEALNGASASEMVFRIRRKNNSIRWLAASYQSIYDSNNKWLGYRSSFRDVTEREEAAVALKRSEEKYRVILNTTTDGILVLNKEGRILFANPATENIFQQQPNKMIGKSVGIPSYFGGLELNVIKKDTSLSVVDAKSVETFWENKPAYIVSLHDITKRKQAEEERDRFFNLSLDMLCIIGIDSYIKRINPAFEKIVGMSESELMSSPLTDFIHTGDITTMTFSLRKLSNGEPVRYLEARFICKDGSYKWLAFTAAPYTEEGLIYAVARDITISKRMTEELENSHALLDVINRTQAQFITSSNPWELFNDLLTNLISLTKSFYGFIVELLYTENNKPFLKSIAITNSIRNRKTEKLNQKAITDEFEFHNLDNLFGNVVLTTNPLIYNNPLEKDINNAFPQGHPKITSFILLPILRGEKVLGVCVLANKKDGYDKQTINFIQPYIIMCSNIIEAYKSEKQRVKAEEALLESENRYHTIITSMSEGIIFQKASGAIQTCNKSSEKILGLSYDKMDEFFHNKLNIIKEDGESLKKEEHPSITCLKTGKAKFNVVMGINRPDKVLKWISVNSKPLFKGKSKNPYAVVTSFTDITERKNNEDKIKASLKEKELLMREIHHRVKNNLQIIISLLKFQSDYIKDKEHVDMFKDSENRIEAMSLVHEKLYQSKDLANIDFHDYIKDLGNEMFGFYDISPGKVALDINVEHIYLEIDIAIPSGLIISELISNAMKHAFPNDLKGNVLVDFHLLSEDEVQLIVNDNGVGLPKDLDFRNSNSLGLKLVTNLVEKQLHGSITCKRDKGTEFIICFKKSKYMKRI